MDFSSPLIAHVDGGDAGTARLRGRADFESARAELRRQAAERSTWELRLLFRQAFRCLTLAVKSWKRNRAHFAHFALGGADGAIELCDVIVVGDAVDGPVHRLTLAGIAAEPRFMDGGDTLRIDAVGVSARLRDALAVRDTSRLTVVRWPETLAPPPLLG